MSNFNPELFQCTSCLSIMKSSYPGQFVKCECGESFVDQTVHYGRYGGNARALSYLIEKDLKDITGLGYEQDDIIKELVSLMEMNGIVSFETKAVLAVTQYDLKIAGLGGSTPRELVEAGRGHKVIEYIDALKEGY